KNFPARDDGAGGRKKPPARSLSLPNQDEPVGGELVGTGLGVLAGDGQADDMRAGGAKSDVAEGGRRIDRLGGVLIKGRAESGAVARQLQNAAAAESSPFHPPPI